jgi:hypothetical protein
MLIAVAVGRYQDEDWWSIVCADDGLRGIDRMEGPFEEPALRFRLAQLGMDPSEVEARLEAARRHQ